jgi:hypothetical protein
MTVEEAEDAEKPMKEALSIYGVVAIAKALLPEIFHDTNSAGL